MFREGAKFMGTRGRAGKQRGADFFYPLKQRGEDFFHLLKQRGEDFSEISKERGKNLFQIFWRNLRFS